MSTPIDRELSETLRKAGISPAAWAKFAACEKAAVRKEYGEREQRRGERTQATAALVSRAGTPSQRLDAIAADHYSRRRAA